MNPEERKKKAKEILDEMNIDSQIYIKDGKVIIDLTANMPMCQQTASILGTRLGALGDRDDFAVIQ